MSTKIVKIGLVVKVDGCVLLVKKRGGTRYILPGGKPENSETDAETLVREVEEELGCSVDLQTVAFLGEFTDVAADLSDTIVIIKLYSADLVGRPRPQSEIETLEWFCPDIDASLDLAPSLERQIIPFLYSSRANHV